MTPERLKAIKDRHEALIKGTYPMRFYPLLSKDLPDCLDEIERLQELVKRPTNNCDCGNPIDHDYCTRCLRQWES